MGDRQQKKIRSQALANFTRNVNSFHTLIAESAPSNLVTSTYQKVENSWDKLEAAQDSFIEVTDIDVDTDDLGLRYLDEPGERHHKVLSAYASFVKKASEDEQRFQKEKEDNDRQVKLESNRKEIEDAKVAEDVKAQEEATKKYDSATAEFELTLDAFNRMVLGIKDTVVDASDWDKRRESQKLEEEFKVVKKQLLSLGSIDPSKDASELKDKFITDAEKLFLDTQKWFFSELKDSSVAKEEPSRANTMKKESVRLPSFQGDEKNSPPPFLTYSIWRKQWQTLIQSYEEEWRAGLLWDHLDAPARNQFVGWETDYKKAMSKLDMYYGDPLKVIRCVMKEVNSQSVIIDGDYKSLISYSVLLENNFNRLSNLSLEHEMSNTSAMSSIVHKFPRLIGEKWNEHLSTQLPDVKARPFPQFVKWLSTQREMWERMSAGEVVKRVNPPGNKPPFYGSGAFYGSGESYKNERSEKKCCFGCGEEGHIIRFCPKTGGKRPKSEQERKSPKIKKFWCAYHKSDSSVHCNSISCQDLRKTDPAKRIQLLKENGDCLHCIGDHKQEECRQKSRICGGGQDNRGCSSGHNIHELFCTNAKCFAVHEVCLSVVNKNRNQETVVLQIMQVRGSKKGVIASTFWDGGCTSNFVREEYAKSSGFQGKVEHLCVTTLGGAVTDLTVMTYKCYLRDEDNVLQEFEAYGLESVTGSLTQIATSKIKQLFPHLGYKFVNSLSRAKEVDFLIGLKHASWHPQRAERASGGGDLWLYRGKFGSCVGGWHPEMLEGTQRSDCQFSVNFVYYANVMVDTTLPHSLDFCSERVSAYTHKAGFCESTRLGRNVCQSSFTSSVGAEELVMQKVASLPSGTEDHMLNVVGSASQLDEAVLSSESNYLIESVSQSSDEGVVPDNTTECASQSGEVVLLPESDGSMVDIVASNTPIEGAVSSFHVNEANQDAKVFMSDEANIESKVSMSGEVNEEAKVFTSGETNHESEVSMSGRRNDEAEVFTSDEANGEAKVFMSDDTSIEQNQLVDATETKATCEGAQTTFMKSLSHAARQNESFMTSLSHAACQNESFVESQKRKKRLLSENVGNDTETVISCQPMLDGIETKASFQAVQAPFIRGLTLDASRQESLTLDASRQESFIECRKRKKMCLSERTGDDKGTRDVIVSDGHATDKLISPDVAAQEADPAEVKHLIRHGDTSAKRLIASSIEAAVDVMPDEVSTQVEVRIDVRTNVEVGIDVRTNVEVVNAHMVDAIDTDDAITNDVKTVEELLPDDVERKRDDHTNDVEIKKEDRRNDIEIKREQHTDDVSANALISYESETKDLIASDLETASYLISDVVDTKAEEIASDVGVNDLLSFGVGVNHLASTIIKFAETTESMDTDVETDHVKSADILFGKIDLKDIVASGIQATEVFIQGDLETYVEVSADAGEEKAVVSGIDATEDLASSKVGMKLEVRTDTVSVNDIVSGEISTNNVVTSEGNVVGEIISLDRGASKVVCVDTSELVHIVSGEVENVSELGVEQSGELKSDGVGMPVAVCTDISAPVKSDGVGMPADGVGMPVAVGTDISAPLKSDGAGMPVAVGTDISAPDNFISCKKETEEVVSSGREEASDIEAKLDVRKNDAEENEAAPDEIILTDEEEAVAVVNNLAPDGIEVKTAVEGQCTGSVKLEELTLGIMGAKVAVADVGDGTADLVVGDLGIKVEAMVDSREIETKDVICNVEVTQDPMLDQLGITTEADADTIEADTDTEGITNVTPDEIEAVNAVESKLKSGGEVVTIGRGATEGTCVDGVGFNGLMGIEIGADNLVSSHIEADNVLMTDRAGIQMKVGIDADTDHVGNLISGETETKDVILSGLSDGTGTELNVSTDDSKVTDLASNQMVTNYEVMGDIESASDITLCEVENPGIGLDNYPPVEIETNVAYKTGPLEGEVTLGNNQHVFFQVTCPDILGRLVERISQWKRMIRVLCWILRMRIQHMEKGLEIELSLAALPATELERAKIVLIRFAQKELEVELALAADKGVGRYRKLAPVCDDEGVWRVGSLLKNFVPFTVDKKMPVIIPPDHRITQLVMQHAHRYSHSGHGGTLCQFWSSGFWTVRAGHLAKSVKNKCVPCRKLTTKTSCQTMGDIPAERLENPIAFGTHCQLDLFGPFSRRGDVNPRSSKKTLCVIVEDVNSGAVHLDVVQDYSTNAVLTSMRRFGTLRGWPSVIYSDPCSQLESAGGKLVNWSLEMKDALDSFAGSKGFRWEISPADSPWRQGKAERRIAVVKRLIKLSVGDTRITPLELLTCLLEIANICNDRPIGLSKPRDDGTYDVITPNQLLTGRSGNPLPDDLKLSESLPITARYRVINHVTSSFWGRWCRLVSPGLVVRQKWHAKSRNFKVGDVVMIADSSKIKSKYKLGVVDVVYTSDDGYVRSVVIRYVLVQNNRVSNIVVTRSVQRLVLILPVEEQEHSISVEDNGINVKGVKS